MDEFVRNVIDIEAADRQALEHVFGRQLHDSQQVVMRVVSPNLQEESPSNGDQADDVEALPEWCNVYEGLSDDEIAAIEEVMLIRANLTRSAE
jgi:hypothetical protein